MPGPIEYHRPAWASQAGKAYERARPRQDDKNFYSSTRWLNFRKRYLTRNPLCVDCLKKGRETLANHVHHVKPRKPHPDLAFAESNLEALCQPCHNAKETR